MNCEQRLDKIEKTKAKRVLGPLREAIGYAKQ